MASKFMGDYNFIEAVEFDSLMPKVAEKVGVIGKSSEIVEMFGAEAKGSDALEVLDVEAPFVGD